MNDNKWQLPFEVKNIHLAVLLGVVVMILAYVVFSSLPGGEPIARGVLRFASWFKNLLLFLLTAGYVYAGPYLWGMGIVSFVDWLDSKAEHRDWLPMGFHLVLGITLAVVFGRFHTWEAAKIITSEYAVWLHGILFELFGEYGQDRLIYETPSWFWIVEGALVFIWGYFNTLSYLPRTRQ